MEIVGGNLALHVVVKENYFRLSVKIVSLVISTRKVFGGSIEGGTSNNLVVFLISLLKSKY